MNRSTNQQVIPAKGALAYALAGAFGGFASFYLLLSVVPEYAAHGGAGPTGSGACTGALMLTTIAIQPLTPRLFTRIGRRRTLAAGGLLLGIPCLLLALSSRLPVLIGINLLRGLGFGIIVVVSVVTVAELAPAIRWGQRMGLYGAVIGLAGIVGSPVGLWTAHTFGYPTAFIPAAVMAIPVLVAAVRVPDAAGRPGTAGGSRPGFAELVRLVCPSFLVECVSTTAYGVVFTFLPLVIAGDNTWLAASALLMVQLTSTAARWGSGSLIDRVGGARLLAPAILISALGILAGAVPGNDMLVLAGMTVFGIGFGITQNASLVVVLRVTRDAGPSSGSVAWNLAFDAGTGIGAMGGGFVLSAGGHRPLFLSAAALLAISLIAARWTARQNELAGNH
jgi:predicted MFS family arabinose efflux permease